MLLRATHDFKATDPRDKLFALIGISDPASCGPVHIDYTKDVSSLYRETARYIITEEQDLSLLHHTGIGKTRKLIGLPSWVPDWSGAMPNIWWQGPNYSATKDRRSDIRGVTLHGVKDWDTIAISGNVVDTIQYLTMEVIYTTNGDGVYEGEPAAKKRYSRYIEMKELIDQHVPEVYITGQPKEEAL